MEEFSGSDVYLLDDFESVSWPATKLKREYCGFFKPFQDRSENSKLDLSKATTRTTRVAFSFGIVLEIAQKIG